MNKTNHVTGSRFGFAVAGLPRFLSGSRHAAIVCWLPIVLSLWASSPGAAGQGANAIDNLPEEFDLSFQTQSVDTSASADLRFNTGAGGKGYVLSIGSYGTTLTREPGHVDLAESGVRLTGMDRLPVTVTVKRRVGRMEALVGPRLVMDVDSDSYHGGGARLVASPGMTISDLRLQPIAPVVFDDDFMRRPDEPGEWNYQSGKWTVRTVGFADRSANAFSLESTSTPEGLATAGYRFWSDVAFRCAVEGSPETTVGICTDVQDAGSYYLLRWRSGAAGALELVCVIQGKETVLATRDGGFIPFVWYQLALIRSGRRLIAEVDHQQVFDVQDTTFGQGEIGLYTAGAGAKTWFDSVMVRSSNMLEDDFNGARHWDLVNGKGIVGDPRWANCTVTADVEGSAVGAAIPLRYRDSKNYYALAWSPSAYQLVAVVNGKRTRT